MSFAETIIHWYNENKRDLPWRNTKNPYRIWLSEIILQQTRVEQGVDYYKKFVKTYPNIKALAAAKEGEVLKLWQGLGYYSRARNLHYTAKEITKRFKGRFPETWEQVRSFKGIGDYTAAAILSFAFDKRYPVVDGNVHRLLSRYLGIKTPLNTAKAKKEFYEAAFKLMQEVEEKDNSTFNQAIMEFGSRQCKPANPDCRKCPLQNSCYAFAKNKVSEFPVKKKKEKPRDRYFHYFVIRKGDKIFLRKRTEKDIWKNMYDFPLVEGGRKIGRDALPKELKDIKNAIQAKAIPVKQFKHQLSHQTIYAKFYEFTLIGKTGIPDKSLVKVSTATIRLYALPRLIDRYLQENS
jgi:A/G-specific adenine glycosylase